MWAFRELVLCQLGESVLVPADGHVPLSAFTPNCTAVAATPASKLPSAGMYDRHLPRTNGENEPNARDKWCMVHTVCHCTQVWSGGTTQQAVIHTRTGFEKQNGNGNQPKKSPLHVSHLLRGASWIKPFK